MPITIFPAAVGGITLADTKIKYGTANQAFTITIASLANAGARQSTQIDNTTDLFLDALVLLKVKTNAAGTAATGYVAVYAYGSTNGGTVNTENAGASDAAITLSSPPNARLIGVINANANGTTYYGGPFSVAAAFGGLMPAFWGIILQNQTGATLDATAGSHSAVWQGVQAQSV